MEEIINYPTGNYSAYGNQMDTESASLNKKRKLPAEQLELPLSKHISLQSSYLESDSVTDANHNDLSPSLIEFQSSRRSSRDISLSGSANDSNIWYSKASLSDQPSTSSVNWASTCSTKSLYSSECRSMARSSSSSDETESSYNIGEGKDLDHNNFGSDSSPFYDDDHDLEFTSHAEHENMEHCTEDGDVINSNGVIPNNYLLSSGGWPANPDNEQGAKKLTIDKEFEEYFSSLML